MMNAMVTVVSSANSIPSEVINNIPIENDSQLNWCGIADGMLHEYFVIFLPNQPFDHGSYNRERSIVTP